MYTDNIEKDKIEGGKNVKKIMWKKIVAFALVLGIFVNLLQSIPSYAVEQVTDENVEVENTEAIQEFQDTISFSVLNNEVESGQQIRINETVPVKILMDEEISDGVIPVGNIEENYPVIENKTFEGAYVVTEDGEDKIAYLGSYADEDNNTYTYYAFNETSDTGILLKDNQYIKLVYKTEFQIKYEIRINSELGEECPDGGTFLYADIINMAKSGENIDVRFLVTKRDTQEGVSYNLLKLYAIEEDGNKTEIALDSTGSGRFTDIKQNITFCAVVQKVESYKLIVKKQNRGHICWAGHGDEKESTPSDPYSTDPVKFCSYDKDGSITGVKGATVTSAPGGTIYFVMYSQAGTKWGFQHLIINNQYIDAVYDGKIHQQTVNGMTVYFRSLGVGKDNHLKANGDKDRSKFECWVTNVAEDIVVDFECESDKRETLTLVQSDGIDSVAASSFDRNYFPSWLLPESVKDFWNSLGLSLSGKDIGKDLVNEYWSGSKESYEGSDNKHTAVETKTNSNKTWFGTDTPKYGSRYVYFKSALGYDPTSITAKITGKDEKLPVGNIANLASGKTGSWLGIFSAETNKSVNLAKKQAYDWYVYYEGIGINFRNISLSCNPYVYVMRYELSGGKLDGKDTYEDEANYSIKPENNKAVMPAKVPVKEGYSFQGWKLVPTNKNPEFSTINIILDPASVFTIDSTTFKYGLETEKTEYELEDGKHIDYNTVPGGNHHFTFVAQWSKLDDLTAPKASYTIEKYQEAVKETEGAIINNGKSYMLMEPMVTKVGTKGQTIIGIPEKASDGFVLSKDSITRLENFMTAGNAENRLIYYYDRLHTISIKKITQGEFADKTKIFNTTIFLFNAKGEPVNGKFACTGNGSDENQNGTISFNNGEAKIGLRDGQGIRIEGLETGSYSIHEESAEGYSTTYTINNEAESRDAPNKADLQMNVDVKIINIKETVPETGIINRNPKIILCLVIMFVGGTLAYDLKKSRRKRR